MAAPTFYYQNIFYFRSAESTCTNRPSPIDMGLNQYYFGVRYRQPGTNTWYIKTSSYKLGDRNNEALAATVAVNVHLADNGTSFVDAPFGIGTVYYELVACQTAHTSWTTTHSGEIIKLPDITINGVTYVNNGSFVVNDWIMATPNVMSFGSTNQTYQYSTINTSATSWDFTTPDWVTGNVYRSGSLVNPANDYIDGDTLRLTPDNNGAADRYEQAWVTITTAGRMIDIYQAGTSPSGNWSFNPYDSITIDAASIAFLTVGATTQNVSWKSDTGLGSSFIDVWIRLYNTTDSVGTTWTLISCHNGTSKDDYWNNCYITTTSGFIQNGHSYTIDITKNNPNI